MRELNIEEVEAVNGGSVLSWMKYAAEGLVWLGTQQDSLAYANQMNGQAIASGYVMI